MNLIDTGVHFYDMNMIIITNVSPNMYRKSENHSADTDTKRTQTLCLTGVISYVSRHQLSFQKDQKIGTKMIHTSTTDSVKTDWSTVVVRNNLYPFCQNRQKSAKIINNKMKYILIYWGHSKLIFSFTLESNVKRMTIDVRHIQSFHTFVSLIIYSQLGSSFHRLFWKTFPPTSVRYIRLGHRVDQDFTDK